MLHPSSSFLLDQLMRYEAVVISDDDETDYTSTEEEGGTVLSSVAMATQVGISKLGATV